MNQKPKLTRRQALLGMAAVAGGLALTGLQHLIAKARLLAQVNGEYDLNLPLVSKSGEQPGPTITSQTTPRTPTVTEPMPTTPSHTPTSTLSVTSGPTPEPGPLDGKVRLVRDANATNWNGSSSPCFYESVNQEAVDNMVNTGLYHLTGESSATAIWGMLFKRINPGGYQAGQKIAIKVNFNNSHRDGNTCSTHTNMIDALPHPVLALIDSMVAAGVRANDIVIYDASARVGRRIPNYFRNPITSKHAVEFVGMDDCGVTPVSYGKDPSLTVTFPGTGIEDRLLADVLYDATYLINVPIIKTHSSDTPVSLGFKNHMGSIEYVTTSSANDDLHRYLNTQSGENPMVNVYSNPNVGPKTILTMGDALFGAFGVVNNAAESWDIFEDKAANSLLFSADPVAIDCVMTDLLYTEGKLDGRYNDTYYYLFRAAAAGLGTCEQGGNPVDGSGYNAINYSRIDI